MADFLFALNSVLPLLTLMASGWLCRKIGLMPDSLSKGINKLIFYVFLPVNLCLSVMNTPYDTAIDPAIFLLVAGCVLAAFGFAFWIVPKVETERTKISVMIQAMGRGNYAFFGIPLVVMLFPGQDTSIAAMLVTVTIPFYNVMSVIALCVYGKGKFSLGRVVKNTVTNPLIIGVALGFVLWLLRFQPPTFLKSALSDLAKVATPLALFTLGGVMQFASAKAHLRQLRIVLSWRLLLAPLIFVGLGVALGVRGIPLACLYIALGAPVAVSSYPMAQQMGGDAELAAECVAISSALCVFSTFLFVYGMKMTGLI